MIAHPRPDDSDGRLDFEEARRRVQSAAAPMAAETIALDDAYGRIIARRYLATEEIVPYARSAMDGFALRAADTQEAVREPIALQAAGALYAGDEPFELIGGTATAIATGAPLPVGADAVVPIERVGYASGAIVLSEPVQPGDHIFPAGDDAKRGETLAGPGDVVTPARAALLAAAGHARIGVYRRPRVAIVCTGDELVAIWDRPGRGQIRNSNATMLSAHLARDGADIVHVVSVPDRVGPLQDALEHAMTTCDLLVTTGGASVGERDLVKHALVTLGARFAFRSVALRPAKPTAFARVGRVLVAVLPGNPAAAFVGYTTLVRVAVRRLAGHRVAIPLPLTATLHGTISAKPDRHFVLFGRVTRDDTDFAVMPLGNQCSSLVRTSADANGLIIVPPGSPNLGDGARVSVEMLDWSALWDVSD